MNQEQINALKNMMHTYRASQGERRESAKIQLLAYLAACLDGIEIIGVPINKDKNDRQCAVSGCQRLTQNKGINSEGKQKFRGRCEDHRENKN